MESTNVDMEYVKNLESILKEMWKEAEKTGDFSIKVEGKMISCHKQVLAAWSPVIKGLLSSGMRESNENELVVENFSYETMKALVDYIYHGRGGELKNLFENNANTSDLLKAAHFYQLPLLMKACEYALVNKLTSENSIEFYKVAKILNAEILRKEAMNMILHNKQKIVSAQDWRTKVKEIKDHDTERDLLMSMLDQTSRSIFVKYTSSGAKYDTAEYTRGIKIAERNVLMNDGYYRTEHYTPDQENRVVETGLQNEIFQALDKNLESTFDDEDTSDLVLTVNGERNVHVHKIFVQRNSGEFFSQIVNNSKDKKSMNIDEIEEIVLKYFYKGIKGITIDKSNAAKLLEIAGKCEIQILRKSCENYLIDTLDGENVLERFRLASNIENIILKEKAFEMMRTKKADIFKTADWKEFAKDNPHIVLEISLEVLSMI